jgi:uncharacterized damage-inducible protein DinB
VTLSALLGNGFLRIPPIITHAVRDLDPQRLATQPAAGTNSIAWLAWHTARGQDAWVGDLDGSEAVWTADGWYAAFALPFAREENGFGMEHQQTSLVVAPAELLTEYLDAVTARTLAYLASLADTELDDIVGAQRQPVVTRGIQLMSILDDGLQHAGQASYARGILDRL